MMFLSLKNQNRKESVSIDPEETDSEQGTVNKRRLNYRMKIVSSQWKFSIWITLVAPLSLRSSTLVRFVNTFLKYFTIN